jgi:uncharacterized membrane protein
MNRAASAFRRFLLKDWDLLVFLVVAASRERVTGVPLTVRTAVSLAGCWFILSILIWSPVWNPESLPEYDPGHRRKRKAEKAGGLC